VKSGSRLISLVLILGVAACGKKGPPLPPLIRIPTPPGSFSVVRQGSTVAIQVAVPGSNTDGSSPADLSRIDVYALTAPTLVSPDEIYRKGTQVGHVLVNPPPDPDTPDGQTPKSSGPLPAGGVDQGATAHLSESFKPDESADPSEIRQYVAVGVNKRGRHGPYSVPVAIPISSPPESPGKPDVTWDETSITITWAASKSVGNDVALAYHVYAPGDLPVRLTSEPLRELTFVDKRIEWGAERCYIIRSVQAIDRMSFESEASPETCVTLADKFPPAAPEGLTIVASEGAMNLIWNPNKESDLAGYRLWRASPADGELVSITPEPIKETTFKDAVPSGTRVAYAVQAVDKAGNVSPLSAKVEETAR
jgi:hypothetical protein